ncbi:MAG: outer membrane protein assembly factor BamE [Burkholderiaceae bacterium]|nr:outer membrane protein assembly factor BamE [Burkholderiaceae bacterium]
MLPSGTTRSRFLVLACSIILASGLAGCGSLSFLSTSKSVGDVAAPADSKGVTVIREDRFLGILTPYRIDVQQGNFVSSETMAQLRDGMKRPEGMTRDQVKFLLGTPLVTDIFHADRWDYVFRLRRGNGELITSHVTVFFKENKLDKVDGTVLPTEKDYIKLIAGNEK